MQHSELERSTGGVVSPSRRVYDENSRRPQLEEGKSDGLSAIRSNDTRADRRSRHGG
jgi:hypothetical protein